MRTIIMIAAILLSTPAFAQDASGVDITPLLEALIGLAVAVITAVSGVVGMWVYSKWGIDINLKDNAILNDALDSAADYALSKLPSRVQVDNDLLALALNYVSSGAPGALDRLGVSEKHLAEMVEASLSRKLGIPKED